MEFVVMGVPVSTTAFAVLCGLLVFGGLEAGEGNDDSAAKAFMMFFIFSMAAVVVSFGHDANVDAFELTPLTTVVGAYSLYRLARWAGAMYRQWDANA